MKKSLLLTIAILSSVIYSRGQDSVQIRKFYDEALVNGQCYENLRYLCKNIGQRLSGSAGAAKSVDWSKKLMESYGFDKVYLQEVMVPHWVRGAKEQAYIIDGKNKIAVPIAALGMSIATPAAGITANIIEVRSLKELDELGESIIKGKIVFFNGPFDQRFIETGAGYGAAGIQRFAGPSAAAKYGAVGAIVRSISSAIDDYPHTGGTVYVDGVKKIPAAAISTLAANKLSNMLRLRKWPLIKFYFKQSCQTLPDVKSYNVIGEITGSQNPNKFITVGGHLDSWDLAEGAHDDGTGVMQSAEVLRIFKATGYRPKNSVRAVFFMNEENGHKGGIKYAELAAANKEEHIAAIETDEGGFTPRGFSFQGVSNEFLKGINKDWKPLFEPYEADRLVAGGGGTDIGPLKETVPSIVLIGFRPDSQRYFDIHHSSNDVFENVNKRELELGAAAITTLVYLIDQHGLSF
ncbi:M20/M25/M40 family metallo-hydrolase [Mucilaginibacter sp. 14171R-50]|uniref:M20/M25/M40 family metallo-hydrolase n=1 Tax=Mucilaginibacter sp. 14171R-50 TaxID=2703789 RepID=UPI00138C01FC|nr:M20/M25/M40 family metallo-hydrolase [Mucilaginibacter sp. 14171R-50]QHS54734.1 M20/M25/M40 family metallo-hydrolase [Mucilaginibacter sp. 14171R-50]